MTIAGPAPKRYGCLRFTHWPVQRRWVEQPRLRLGPLVVHAGDGRRGEWVVAACPRAERAGVRPSLPLTEAVALLSRVPGSSLTLAPHDPRADLAALAQLAEAGNRFSPFVGWDTLGPGKPTELAEEPGHLFFDLSGTAALFGGEDALAGQIEAWVRASGYRARLTIADTLGGAWALADGFHRVIVPPGRLPEALHPLPVDRLRLTAGQTEILGQLGIVTIGQLMKISRAGLADRFGPLIGLRLDQATGSAAEALLPFRPPTRFHRTLEPESSLTRREDIATVARQLTTQLADDLTRRQLGALHLRLKLVDESGAVTVEQFGVYRATSDADTLSRLIRLRIDRLTVTGPIRRIELEIDRVGPVGWQELQLFSDDEQRTEPDWALLIERLTNELGAEAVLAPRWNDDAVPERTCTLCPALPLVRSRSRLRPTGPRPWLLFAQPPVIATSVARPDAAPDWFDWQRVRYQVRQFWGPERIETGWWRGPAVRRDYFRVETAEGLHFWLYRDLIDGDWRLHGRFS
jgi:protein ImuB